MPKPAKMPSPRLTIPPESDLTPRQRDLLADIRKSRGSAPLGGPFAVFLQAPEYGDLAQKLGAFCRYRTAVPPHLSEFTILVLARFWRSQFEFFVHAPIAEKTGIKADTIKALRTGRAPRLTKEERAISDFIAELHRTKRVSDRTYGRVRALFGDAGMVEFVGILGYYTLVAMTLNVFRVPIPDGEVYPFAEPRAR